MKNYKQNLPLGQRKGFAQEKVLRVIEFLDLVDSEEDRDVNAAIGIVWDC